MTTYVSPSALIALREALHRRGIADFTNDKGVSCAAVLDLVAQGLLAIEGGTFRLTESGTAELESVERGEHPEAGDITPRNIDTRSEAEIESARLQNALAETERTCEQLRDYNAQWVYHVSRCELLGADVATPTALRCKMQYVEGELALTQGRERQLRRTLVRALLADRTVILPGGERAYLDAGSLATKVRGLLPPAEAAEFLREYRVVDGDLLPAGRPRPMLGTQLLEGEIVSEEEPSIQRSHTQ